MIFNVIEAQEDYFKLDGSDVNILTRLFEQLRREAARYVGTKTSGRVDEDDISIDSGWITWKNTYNDSCHCHPNMVTDTHTYPLEEFKEWLKSQNTDFYV